MLVFVYKEKFFTGNWPYLFEYQRYISCFTSQQEHSNVVKGMDSGITLPGFESWLDLFIRLCDPG